MNNYTTKTASLLATKIKGTKADITYLNIDGNPFSKVVSANIPETPTENDIWKYVATTDDNGVVTITDDVTVDYTELTDAQKAITKTAAKVIDNKVLDANDQLLMNWDTKNFTNSSNSIMSSIFNTSSTLIEWNSDLSSLTNGLGMFYYSALQSFNGDLSSLTNGELMFSSTGFTLWNIDLPNLTNGDRMFYDTPLESFSGDLSSLSNGFWMFYDTSLTSFNGDLPSLTDGYWMFRNCSALASFNGDLSSLTNGDRMFYNTALQSFISNLSSLKSGYRMFDNSRLDEESIMLIADTINDISSLDKTVDSDWEYACNLYGNFTTRKISSSYRGVLYLGYDATTITDTTNIFSYCNEIVAKGWTVYLNGSEYTSTDSDSTALIDGESTSTPIPHYYKPVQVTNDEVAEYVDQNGNYYIIVGAQHIFGDDISTYGMFTSHQHAVSEITTALGLTPYEKPAEEPKYNILY